MTIPNARNLSLGEVQRLFGFQEEYCDSFPSWLQLENLTDEEQKDLIQIRDDFRSYLTAGKVSEGQVKFLVVAPLMRLAGFYRYPLEIKLEEDIANIQIEDEDVIITGRMDILAVNKVTKSMSKSLKNTSFWTLVIESKNSQLVYSFKFKFSF